MTIAQFKNLEKAYKLLSRPGVWTTDASARNANGDAVTYSSVNACQFCSVGAVRKVTNEWFPYEETILCKIAIDYSKGYIGIEDVNYASNSFDDPDLQQVWMTSMFYALGNVHA